MCRKIVRNGVVLAGISWVMACIPNALAQQSQQMQQQQSVLQRLEALEQENQVLKANQRKLIAEQSASETAASSNNKKRASSTQTGLQTNAEFGYGLLDPTTDIRFKQLAILQARQDGTLPANSVNLQGAVTAIANYQESNEADRFGYLMRHPTGANQVGTSVSEAVGHSAQRSYSASLGGWVSANMELLFDPEQSFGSGINTDIERNQVHVRKAFVLLGNLAESPFYLSLGKMVIPFGLTDTVNPFTASTVWHAFGGIANGATLGYVKNGLNLSFMAIEGGSQFRAANTPVNGTNVPSKLNNHAVDVNYTVPLADGHSLLAGASYQRGSAYCQEFPIQHFEPCNDNNPAYDIYARYQAGKLTLKAEWAETTEKWPGTFNPVSFPQFAASDVTSFDVGLKYRSGLLGMPADVSVEFSRFDAGPDDAPWEKQDQYVLGLAAFATSSVKLFAEYIRTDGFAPLNFLSGGLGGTPAGPPLSSATAHSDVYLVGINAAF
ncbi:MAG: hypothetical protein HKO84_03365 [Pseudomonadales bacterium]|nr:hypothetical protein [Pseudomonadales bacterium]